jgi:ParB family chromosome partitioning protein
MFFEEAKALSVTMKMRKLTQREMAKSLGVSQSYIANKLRLLGLNENMQKQISDNKLTERHARALLRLKFDSDRQKVLDKVCVEKLSVARTEALVDLLHFEESQKGEIDENKLKLIYAFEEKTRKSLKLLNSCGVRSFCNTNYENEKIYITISIDRKQFLTH